MSTKWDSKKGWSKAEAKKLVDEAVKKLDSVLDRIADDVAEHSLSGTDEIGEWVADHYQDEFFDHFKKALKDDIEDEDDREEAARELTLEMFPVVVKRVRPGKRASETLRAKVAALANDNPTLRVALVPLLKAAMEHPTEEAKKKYMEEHPGAEPSNHTVKEKKDDGGGAKPGGDKKGPSGPKAQKAWRDAGKAFGEHQQLEQDEVDVRRALKSGKPTAKGKARDFYDKSQSHAKKLVGYAKTILDEIDPDSLDESGKRILSEAKGKFEKAKKRIESNPKDSKHLGENDDPIFLGGLTTNLAINILYGLSGIMNKASKRAGLAAPGITSAVATIEKLATEFSTEEAKKKYMDEHPDADPSNHTVKEKKDDGGGKEKDEGKGKPVKVDKRLKDTFLEPPQHDVFKQMLDAVDSGEAVDPEIVRKGLELLKNWQSSKAAYPSQKQEWREQAKILKNMLKTGTAKAAGALAGSLAAFVDEWLGKLGAEVAEKLEKEMAGSKVKIVPASDLQVILEWALPNKVTFKYTLHVGADGELNLMDWSIPSRSVVLEFDEYYESPFPAVVAKAVKLFSRKS